MEKQKIMNSIKDLIYKGNYVDAIILTKEYKNLFNSNEEIQSIEAILNIYLEDYDGALECIREGLKYNIFSSDLYYTMGNIFELRGDYKRAYICYEYALHICNNNQNKAVIKNSMNGIIAKYNIDIKKISFIILTYNQLEYTKLCLNSIRNYNSPETYEIIIVDNASTDGTKEWLQGQKDIKVIFNDDNKGFPAGCNQGIQIAEKGNDIFLLNNDTVIMPNSIFNMRLALYSKVNIGATGAVSNSVSYYQQIEENFETFDEYMDYALINNISNGNRYEERVKLVGFAMLIKREALNKVGLLDERFTPGNFEDDDLSLRIVKNNYKLLLCKDSFIYHFGSVSFKATNTKYNELININHNKFESKWGFKVSDTLNIYKLCEQFIKDKDIVAEVYCGTGSNLLYLKSRINGISTYGYEESEILKEIISTNCSLLTFSENNFNKFDAVFCSDVFRLKKEEKIDNIKSILKDGGLFIGIIDPFRVKDDSLGEILNNYINSENLQFVQRINETNVNGDVIRVFTIFKKIGSEERFNKICNYVNKGNIYLAEKNIFKEVRDRANSIDKENVEIIRNKLYEANNVKFLLRRMENSIQTEEDEEVIVNKIMENILSVEALINIIDNNIIEKVEVINKISLTLYNREAYRAVLTLLEYSYKIDDNNDDTLFNLGYIYWNVNEYEKAFYYLSKINNKDAYVIELLGKIGKIDG